MGQNEALSGSLSASSLITSEFYLITHADPAMHTQTESSTSHTMPCSTHPSYAPLTILLSSNLIHLQKMKYEVIAQGRKRHRDKYSYCDAMKIAAHKLYGIKDTKSHVCLVNLLMVKDYTTALPLIFTVTHSSCTEAAAVLQCGFQPDSPDQVVMAFQ